MNSFEPARERADRRAEALGVVEPQRVDAGAIVAGLGARLHDGVAKPRAVHVHGKARAARHLGDALQGGEWPHRAVAAVRGVLDRDQPRARGVAAIGVADRGLDLLAGEHAVRAVEHADHDASVGGGTAAFGIDDMRGPVGDDLVAQPAMDADGNLVGHRAARQKDRILLAEKFADPLAQALDRGILVFLLVADFGLGHGLAHAGGGFGFGIAIEVDETILHGVSCSPASP